MMDLLVCSKLLTSLKLRIAFLLSSGLTNSPEQLKIMLMISDRTELLDIQDQMDVA